MEQIIHKRYVARRRARFKGCNGQQVNIPYGIEVVVPDPEVLVFRPLVFLAQGVGPHLIGKQRGAAGAVAMRAVLIAAGALVVGIALGIVFSATGYTLSV